MSSLRWGGGVGFEVWAKDESWKKNTRARIAPGKRRWRIDSPGQDEMLKQKTRVPGPVPALAFTGLDFFIVSSARKYQPELDGKASIKNRQCLCGVEGQE
jgi:hypothetical protein